MPQKICPIMHRRYLANQEERWKEPFPLAKEKGYSIRTIGIGEGHTTLFDTVDRFCNHNEIEGVVFNNIHPFSRTADARLEGILHMDHLALQMLLEDPEQKFLLKIYDVFRRSRIEVRYAFTEGQDHIRTIGAEFSIPTQKWFPKDYDYYRDVSRQHKPLMLALLPPKVTPE